MATSNENVKFTPVFTGVGNYAIPTTGTGAIDLEEDQLGNVIDLLVILTDDGTDTTLVEGTDYTISGRTVEITNSALTGDVLTIVRETPNTHEYDFTENEPFPASQFTNALDRLTFMSQTQQEQLDRILKYPITDEDKDSTLPNAALRQNTFLAFDDNSEPFASTGTGTPTSAVMATVIQQTTLEDARTAMGVAGLDDANTFTENQIIDGDLDVTGDADITGTLGVTGQATVDDIDVTGESTGPGELVNGKYIGELIFIDGPAKAPSANFPALCVSTINTFATIDAANWPDLVPIERAKLATYLDTGAGGTTSFPGGAAALIITLDSSTAANAMLAALERHAAAYGDDFASCGAINDGTTDFEIDDVNAVTREITVTAGAPGAGPYRFYPHRIAGSTTTARIQSWRGRAPVGANGSEGQTVSGFMRRDAFQGHWHILRASNANGNSGYGNERYLAGADTTGSGIWRGDNDSNNIVSVRAPQNDGTLTVVANPVRTDTTTHPADSSVNIYKHGGRYVA